MNLDQGYQEIPYENIINTTYNQLDDLPNDYFYNIDYNYLTLPEVQLLILLSDSQISYSFSGFRKTTSLHQHQLTKALKRLQDRGFLTKTKNGTYETTNLGSKKTRELLHELLSKKVVSKNVVNLYSYKKNIRFIPPCNKEFLISNFEKRWFSNFRFLYSKNSDEKTELCWEDNKKNKIHMYINNDAEIDIEYRSVEPKFSELQSAVNWIVEEITKEVEVKYEIRDINDNTPYN